MQNLKKVLAFTSSSLILLGSIPVINAQETTTVSETSETETIESSQTMTEETSIEEENSQQENAEAVNPTTTVQVLVNGEPIPEGMGVSIESKTIGVDLRPVDSQSQFEINYASGEYQVQLVSAEGIPIETEGSQGVLVVPEEGGPVTLHFELAEELTQTLVLNLYLNDLAVEPGSRLILTQQNGEQDYILEEQGQIELDLVPGEYMAKLISADGTKISNKLKFSVDKDTDVKNLFFSTYDVPSFSEFPVQTTLDQELVEAGWFVKVYSDEEVYTYTVGEEGEFTIALETGEYQTVLYNKDGKYIDEAPLIIPESGGTLNINYHSKDAAPVDPIGINYTVRGFLNDEPLGEGALVKVITENDTYSFMADAEGYIPLDLLPGDYQLNLYNIKGQHYATSYLTIPEEGGELTAIFTSPQEDLPVNYTVSAYLNDQLLTDPYVIKVDTPSGVYSYKVNEAGLVPLDLLPGEYKTTLYGLEGQALAEAYLEIPENGGELSLNYYVDANKPTQPGLPGNSEGEGSSTESSNQVQLPNTGENQIGKYLSLSGFSFVGAIGLLLKKFKH